MKGLIRRIFKKIANSSHYFHDCDRLMKRTLMKLSNSSDYFYRIFLWNECNLQMSFICNTQFTNIHAVYNARTDFEHLESWDPGLESRMENGCYGGVSFVWDLAMDRFLIQKKKPRNVQKIDGFKIHSELEQSTSCFGWHLVHSCTVSFHKQRSFQTHFHQYALFVSRSRWSDHTTLLFSRAICNGTAMSNL